MMTLSNRLDLERRNRKPSEITDLNLDNSKAAEIEGLTDEYCNLSSLSLINVGLQTLKGFPSLPKLKKLELSDNRIAGGLSNLSGCPNLEQLSLSGNKIKDIETLRDLACVKRLQYLDLYNCEVTSHENYRKEVFTMLPNLTYLDGFDQNNEEEPEDEDDEDEDDKYDDEEEGENDLDDVDDEEGDDDDAVVVGEDDDDDDLDLDDDDDDEDLDGEEEEEEEDEVGLEVLQRDDLEDDPEDYAPGEEEDEDTTGEDSALHSSAIVDDRRGVKRKHQTEDNDEQDD